MYWTNKKQFPRDLIIFIYLFLLHSSLSRADMSDCNVYFNNFKLPFEYLKSGEIVFTPSDNSDLFNIVSCNVSLKTNIFYNRKMTVSSYELKPDQCYLGPFKKDHRQVLYKCLDESKNDQGCFVNAHSRTHYAHKISSGQKIIINDFTPSTRPILIACKSKILNNNYSQVSLKNSECFLSMSPDYLELYMCSN
jgi:hypothetical protein